MIPLLQLDPMSLFIWMEPGKFGEGSLGDASRAALHAAWQGDGFAEAIQDHAASEDEAEQAAWFGSCMWHEKRHFFDLCLTGYGAWRLRHVFAIAGNSTALGGAVTAAEQPAHFPHTAYADPVRRKILGIPTLAPTVTRLAQDIASRKAALAREAAPLSEGGKQLRIGGDAQMEALALVSQGHCLARLYGGRLGMRVFDRFVNRMDRAGLYRWVELLSGSLGCARETEHGLEMDHELATALLVAGLCGRWLGPGRDTPGVIQPSERLGRLMQEMGPRPGRFGMTTEECAERVDTLARRIWGRGLWDEIEADIDENDRVGAMLHREFGKLDDLCAAFDELQDLRRRLLSHLREVGPAGMSPRAFGADWADTLRPHLLHVEPAGSDWNPEDDDRTVHFGMTLSDASGPAGAVAWAWRIKADEHAPPGIALDPKPWSFMLEYAAPLAKLALMGRKQELMLWPEMEHLLGTMKAEGIAVRFEPASAGPVIRDAETRRNAARSYADLTRRPHFTCDITGETIPPGEAMLLRSPEFRASPLVNVFRERTAHIADYAPRRLMCDWSDWIVRADLLG